MTRALYVFIKAPTRHALKVCLRVKDQRRKTLAYEQKMADSEFPKANPARKEEGGGDGADKQRRESAMPEHDGKSLIHQLGDRLG